MLLNRNNFVLSEIPRYLPLLVPSSEYVQFWRAEKRKCIEGYWSMGTWCPPQLYFYLNFWHIKVSEDIFSGNKTYAFPFFRELEWQKAYMYTEASGFSGFADDEEYTCHLRVRDYDPEVPRLLPESVYKKDGTLKTYVDARSYMQQFFPKSLGKPLYENEKKNIIDIEARETGKSYWASSCIAHNFLFDGYTDYDKLLEDQSKGKIKASETLVGSINTSYSDDLLKKVQDGIRLLPWEEMDLKGQKIPAFFAKETTGSWKAGPNPILANYEKRVPGGWIKGGSQSKIHHRSMSDDLAGNGTRPNKIFIEEAGFQGNIKALLGALRDCTTTSGVKIGSIIMMGTGGEMDGATMEVQDVFYNPDEYDCVSFEDTWEHSGRRIGYFACQPMADNEYLDKQTGKIDFEKGYAKSMARREKLKKGKDKTAYNKELENKPLIPSEAFLVTGSNPFPVAELKEQLKLVETATSTEITGILGTMITNPLTGKPEFKPDTEDELRMPDWPIRRGDNDKKKGRDTETIGAVCIWHFPNPEASYYWYSGGYDPTRFEEAPTSVSLDSFFLLERGSVYNGGVDRIVLEYTGRPDGGEFQKTLLKIFNYYDPNGTLAVSCLYENNIRDFYSTCLQAGELHYLALSPGIIQSRVKASENEYGLNSANGKVKGEILKYLKNWVGQTIHTDGEGNKKLQLHTIYSKGLLKELIAYNEDGNFDRIIALALAVINAQQMYKIEVEKEEKKEDDPFTQWLSKKHFSHTRR